MPAPSQATLYRLVTALARPGELPSGPVRQTPASFDGRAFTPTTALRPGEQVQVDTTRLDVLALFDDGTLARPAEQHTLAQREQANLRSQAFTGRMTPGRRKQVVALSGQDIHILCPDGGGEAVLAGHLFADPGFSVIGADPPQAARSGGCSRPPPPQRARRHWPGSGT
ncbi:hypothetical protein [Streptomyces sp. NPDC006527]|uniref:hypothetical protein n=1 Tax=Streptomyces sp. NPDC006527 TaxID=3364749 RepID=UPI0036ABF9E7